MQTSSSLLAAGGASTTTAEEILSRVPDSRKFPAHLIIPTLEDFEGCDTTAKTSVTFLECNYSPEKIIRINAFLKRNPHITDICFARGDIQERVTSIAEFTKLITDNKHCTSVEFASLNLLDVETAQIFRSADHIKDLSLRNNKITRFDGLENIIKNATSLDFSYNNIGKALGNPGLSELLKENNKLEILLLKNSGIVNQDKFLELIEHLKSITTLRKIDFSTHTRQFLTKSNYPDKWDRLAKVNSIGHAGIKSLFDFMTENEMISIDITNLKHTHGDHRDLKLLELLPPPILRTFQRKSDQQTINHSLITATPIDASSTTKLGMI